MRDIKVGTVVRLRRNSKIMGTVVKIGKNEAYQVSQNILSCGSVITRLIMILKNTKSVVPNQIPQTSEQATLPLCQEST